MEESDIMYSWEIARFLAEHNYIIGGNDLLKIISIEENPQINHIKYNENNNTYEMWDNEGNYFIFTSILQEDEPQKKLVKSIWKK